MKKKKTLKIVSKVCCIILLFTVIISAFVVPSFAYQTTNSSTYPYMWGGMNSYNICPITSMYYTNTNYGDGIYTQYSVNVPNMLTLRKKSAWVGQGLQLNGTYEERFGNQSFGRFYAYDWETYRYESMVENDIPSRKDFLEYYCTTDVLDASEDYQIYPYVDTDKLGSANQPGFNLDCISWVINQPDWNTSDALGFTLEFEDVITTQKGGNYLGILQYTAPSVNSLQQQISIKYSCTYETADRTYNHHSGEFLVSEFGVQDLDNIISVDYNGMYYDRISFSIFNLILTYMENDGNAEGIDVETNRLIRFNSVSVGATSTSSNPIVQIGVTTPYIRPYDADLVRSFNANTDHYKQYTDGYYTNPLNRVKYIFDLKIRGRSPLEGDDGLPIPPKLEIGQLGESIGEAVEGVFQAEIFPNVSLWTLLLIPFSLGLVYAFIKFFAGG